MADLELKKVTKSYGSSEVIRGIDMKVEHGEFCVFVGPSGCGKSTLLRMISGLDNLTSGLIVIEGEEVNDVPAADRGLSMVFQSYALYPHMSVKQNLTFGLENMQMPRDEIERKITEVASMLQIEELLGRRPKDLSGGQRQRVAIGRAVVREPRIFLFDEPLSNLDAELRVDMRGEISALHRRLGNTMIYVTHDQVEAMTMADKIAVLRSGVVEQFGKPLDLYNAPANRFVAGFIGSPKMNFLDAVVKDAENGMLQMLDGGCMQISAQDFSLTKGQAVTVGIRPNAVMPCDADKAALTVKVKGVERLGGESYLYTRTASDIAVTVHLAGQTAVEIDAAVGLQIDETQAHLFDSETTNSLRL